MGATGEELGVDLYDLSTVSDDLLPQLAAAFGDAASDLGAVTREGATAAFTWPSRPEGGGTGPVFGPWFSVRDQLLGYLNTTMTNVNGTATALHMAVSDYASTDHAAAQELQQLQAQNAPPAAPLDPPYLRGQRRAI